MLYKYKCHIGSCAPRRTIMESKKINLITDPAAIYTGHGRQEKEK